MKFRGDNGSWHGVETTSGGGWADDDWQRTQFPTMTPKAIANGVYMQPLTKKETAAVIAESLLESYESQRSVAADEARIKLALLILDHYPKDILAMAHAYFGYLGLRQRLFVEKYPQPSDIPARLRTRFEQRLVVLGEQGQGPWLSGSHCRDGSRVPRENSARQSRQRESLVATPIEEGRP